MKYTQEQILNALETISDICEEVGCPNCPFSRTDGDCWISNVTPSQWVLNTQSNWKAIIDSTY